MNESEKKWINSLGIIRNRTHEIFRESLMKRQNLMKFVKAFIEKKTRHTYPKSMLQSGAFLVQISFKFEILGIALKCPLIYYQEWGNGTLYPYVLEKNASHKNDRHLGGIMLELFPGKPKLLKT